MRYRTPTIVKVVPKASLSPLFLRDYSGGTLKQLPTRVNRHCARTKIAAVVLSFPGKLRALHAEPPSHPLTRWEIIRIKDNHGLPGGVVKAVAD